ncbi:ubiquitin-like protein ATG12 [Tubulanus polymorphus]|uniref:ubiquitin-like protein ATG12 n=1 Tax=Tubulanus polymorphus TaxID=672921 RepID=UPI003DA64846
MADAAEEPAEGATAPSDSNNTTPSASPSRSKLGKVDVLLKAAGDAPIMKKKKWVVDPGKRVGWIIDFIKRYIKCEPSESLFLYVNQSFCPSPDTEVGVLYNCFGSDGKLVLHYCKSQAWG